MKSFNTIFFRICTALCRLLTSCRFAPLCHQRTPIATPQRLSMALLLALAYPSLSFGAYDYSHCLKYFAAASTPIGDTYAISLKTPNGQKHILYSPTRPKAKILKSDPFIGLYLIDTPKTKQSYDLLPLDSRTLKDKNLALISKGVPSKGAITKRQNGFLRYAQFSSNAPRNAVLGNICYQIYGLSVGGNKFIEKKYIDRFLAQKSPYYGDLGIRAYGTKPIITTIDPFVPHNPFKPNDEILSINGKKISSSGELEWVMSNLKKDSTAKVQLQRDGKILTLQAKVSQRYGGFLLKETFLERFGLEIDEHMVIKATNPAIAGRFAPLRVGDKILWINKEPILTSESNVSESSTPNSSPTKAFERLKYLLSKAQFDDRFDGQMQLLIVRDNLEIFIKL